MVLESPFGKLSLRRYFAFYSDLLYFSKHLPTKNSGDAFGVLVEYFKSMALGNQPEA
jgi:hypothetical protein